MSQREQPSITVSIVVSGWRIASSHGRERERERSSNLPPNPVRSPAAVPIYRPAGLIRDLFIEASICVRR